MLLFLSSLLLAGAAMGAPAENCPTPVTPVQPAVASPKPLQPGMVTNCIKFHKVTSGETCSKVAQDAHISLENFRAYNTGIDDKCTNLLLDNYVCISVNGTPVPPKGPPGKIVELPGDKPSPLQAGVVGNCKKFYQVQSGEACIIVAGYFGITLEAFFSYNTGIDKQCTNLAAGSYACVAVEGTATPPTLPGKIVALPADKLGNMPTPLQLGVVLNCDKFYQVQSGEICNTVAGYFGITFDVLRTFNAGIDETCTNLRAGAYACVSVDGEIPTTPRAKYQPGAVENCVYYYTVTNGQNCKKVAKKNSITVDALLKFNTKLKDDCSNLIPGADACVAISKNKA